MMRRNARAMYEHIKGARSTRLLASVAVVVAVLASLLFAQQALAVYGIYEIGQYSGHIWDVVVDGDFAYLADCHLDNALRIINVGNPSNPYLVGSLDLESTEIVHFVKQGSLLYVANGDSGFSIVNVTNLVNPWKVGSFNPGLSFQEATSVELLDRSGHLYALVTFQYGYSPTRGVMYILNVDNPANPYEVSHIEASTIPGWEGSTGNDPLYSVAVDGNYAYVGSGRGLRIFDISNLDNPYQVGSIHTLDGFTLFQEKIFSVEKVGSHLFLAAEEYGLWIVNVADPTYPFAVSHWDPPGYAKALDVEVTGNLAYVAVTGRYYRVDGVFAVIDISNLISPSVRAYNDTYEATTVEAVTVGDYHYAYVGDYAAGRLRVLIVDFEEPSNPTSTTETHGAPNGSWGSIGDPAFTWSGASDDGSGSSGVAGYYVYWGTSSSGTSTDYTTSASYDPGAVSSGSTYYLRVQTKDNAGNTSGWTTLFTFKYDGTAPSNPTSATETYGAPNDSWQKSVSNPAFTWSGASDAHSGVAGYYIYWGTSSSGTSTDYTTSASYNPGAVSSGSTYYLRVETKDNVGNTSGWTTLFTFKYDSTAPSNPTSATETNGVTDDTWQNSVDGPAFTWSGASDAHSGVAGYYVYWGTFSIGTSTDYQTDAAYDPGSVSSGSTYYLRMQTKDNVGNTSGWTTLFTFKYDGTAPSNPTWTTETHGASNGSWQNSVSDPAFTWNWASDAHSGVAGYYVYWGTSSSGTSTDYQVDESYDPDAVSSGVYYLRVQTKDNAGNTADWTTLFTFEYDGTAPSNPISATETHGAPNDSWQNSVSNPAFTWSGASDAHSGVAGYYVYWGTSSSGTSTLYRTGTSYDPGAVSSGSTYYLRVQTKDSIGNTAGWTTLFTFKFDDTAPSNPTSTTETHGATDDTWQDSVSDPAFTWSGASDTGSGVARYYVYWGDNPSGTSSNHTTSASYDPPVSNNGIYYLRVETKDNAGNTAGWTTLFTFKFDDTAPSNPTSATEIHGAPNGSWQNSVSDPAFTWSGTSDGSGSGVAGYYVYWGTISSGTSTDYQTGTSYDPPAVSNGIYYLRVQTRDYAGYTSDWTTLFTFKFDDTAPSNPSSTTETHGAPHDSWQNSVNNPAFTWSGASDGSGSGVAGYFVYWGASSSGTSSNYQVYASYDPPAVSSGTVYYLRVQTVDDAGHASAWGTLFIFKYDNTTPSNPTWATETHGAPNGSWSSVGDPSFTWGGASDTGSGVECYYVYWGASSSGTSTDYQIGASYTPEAASSGNTYYLRVRASDYAGNLDGWTTLFTFKYDGTPPSNPTSVTETHGAPSGSWQNWLNDASFTWSGASDAHTGVAGYYVYWGASPSGTGGDYVTSAVYDPYGVEGGIPYYLRVQTRDNVGNLAEEWTTLFTLQYDGTDPYFSYIAETQGLTSGECQSTYPQPGFSWQAVDPGDPSGIDEVVATTTLGYSSFGDTGDYIASYTTSISDTVMFQAVDNAGNTTMVWKFTFCYVDPEDSEGGGWPTTPALDVDWPPGDREGGGYHLLPPTAPLVRGGGAIFGDSSYLEQYEAEFWYTGLGGEQIRIDRQFLTPEQAESWQPSMPYPGYSEVRSRAQSTLADGQSLWSEWITATFGFDDNPPPAPAQVDLCGLESGAWTNEECLAGSWSAVTDWPAGLGHYSWCFGSGTCTPTTTTSTTSAAWTAGDISADGEYRLRVTASDRVTNTSGVSEFSYRLDRVTPTLSIVSPPSSLVSDTISLSWNSDDERSGLDHHTISLDGPDGPYTYDAPGSASSWSGGEALSEGAYDVTLSAHDQAGNVTTLSSWSVEVDLSAPVVSDGSVDSGSVQDPAFSASAMATDDHAIGGYEWRADDVSGATSEPAWSVSLSAEGTYPIEVRATDEVGNWSDWEIIGQAIYDETPPSPSSPPDPPPAPGGATNDATFTLPDDPDVAYWVFSVQPTGETFTATTPVAEYTVPLAASGVYTVTVDACDEYDNCTESGWVHTVVFDDVAPQVSIEGYSDWVATTSLEYTVTVTDDVDDDPLLWYCRGSGCTPNQPLGGDTITWDVSSSGEYIVVVEARDDAHNVGSIQSLARVDLTRPTIATLFVNEPDWQRDDRAPVFTWSAQDEHSGLADYNALVQRTGASEQSFTLPSAATQYTADEVPADFEGTVVLSLKAHDQVTPPWWSDWSTSAFRYDGRAPSILAVGAVGQEWQNARTTTQVDVSAVDGGSGADWVRYGLCAYDTNPTECSPVTPVPGDGIVIVSASSEQPVTLTVAAADVLGNVVTQTVYTLRFDDTEPRLELNDVPPVTGDPSITIAASVTDAAPGETYVALIDDGETVDTCTDLDDCVLTFAGEGDYLVRLVATDEAGNTAYLEDQVTYDASAPEVSLQVISTNPTMAGAGTGATTQVSLADGVFEVSWSAPEASSWRFSVNGEEHSSGTGGYGSDTVPVPAVATTMGLLVEVWDGAGNRGSAAVSVQVVADLDDDGIGDLWERNNGFNWHEPTDAAGDLDSDGLTNLEEYLNGSCDPRDPDTDNDGLSDGDEVHTYGTDPDETDTDGDGLPDGWEVGHGTDPLTPTSQEEQVVLDLSPAELTVGVGQTAHMAITVVNLGQMSLSAQLVVEFPGGAAPGGAAEGWTVETGRASRPLTLDAGSTGNYSLSLVWDTAGGDFSVMASVGETDARASVNAVDVNWLSLQDVAHPLQAHPGETVDIDASLRNVSDEAVAGVVFDIYAGDASWTAQKDVLARELWMRQVTYTIPGWDVFPDAAGAHVDVTVEAAQGYVGEIAVVSPRFDFYGEVSRSGNEATYIIEVVNSGNQAGTLVARLTWPAGARLVSVVSGNAWIGQDGALLWQEMSAISVGSSCAVTVILEVDDSAMAMASNNGPTPSTEPGWTLGSSSVPGVPEADEGRIYLPLVLRGRN